MQVAVIGDTHVPSRATGVPDWVRERIRSADHVVHTGDFDSREAYETIADLAPALTAVSGNMDRGLDLPAVATADRGGVRFVVTHGTGSRRGYGVAGHTHEVLDTTVDGVRLLNPGSATGAAPAAKATMLWVRAADGTLSVDVLE